MRNFQQKRGYRDILFSRPVLVFLGFLLLFFAWGVVGFLGKMQVTMQNKEMTEKRVKELQKDKEYLTYEIEKLQTKDGVEESIRAKFGLAKEGENAIIVVEEKPQKIEVEASTGGFWGFLKNWFR